MKCPVCQAWVFVKETRTLKDNSRTRTYECANEHRFRSSEKIVAVKRGDRYGRYIRLEIKK